MSTGPCLTMTTINGDASSVRLLRRGEVGDDGVVLPDTVVVGSDDPGFSVVKNDDAVLCIKEVTEDARALVNPMKGLGFGAFVLLNRFDNKEPLDAPDVKFWDKMQSLVYNEDDSGCRETNMLSAVVACLAWNRALKFSAMDKRSHTAVEKISSLLYTDMHKLHDNLDRATLNSSKDGAKRRWRTQMYDSAVSEMTCPRQIFADGSDGNGWKVTEEQSWLVHVLRSDSVASRCNQEEVLELIRQHETMEFVKLGPWKLLVYMCRVLSSGAAGGGGAQGKLERNEGGQRVLERGEALLANMKTPKSGMPTAEDVHTAKVLAFRCFVEATLDIMRVKEMGAEGENGVGFCADVCRCTAGLLKVVQEAELQAVSASILDVEPVCTKLCAWWKGVSSVEAPAPEDKSATEPVAETGPDDTEPTSEAHNEPQAPVVKGAASRARSKRSKVPQAQAMCIGNCTQAMALVVALAADLTRPALGHRHTRSLAILDTKLAMSTANQNMYRMVAMALQQALDDFRAEHEDTATAKLQHEISHCTACFEQMFAKESPATNTTVTVLSQLHQLRNTIAVFQQSMAASGEVGTTEANGAFALFYAAVLSLLAGQRKPPRVIESDAISFLSKYEVLTMHVFTVGLYEALTKHRDALEPVPADQPCEPAEQPQPSVTADDTSARDDVSVPAVDQPEKQQDEKREPPEEQQPSQETTEQNTPESLEPSTEQTNKKNAPKKRTKRKREDSIVEDADGAAHEPEPDDAKQKKKKKKKKKKKVKKDAENQDDLNAPEQ